MKRPLSFYKLVMAAAVALPSMALADITPVAPQLDPTDNCYMIGSAAELYGFAAMVNDEGKSDACGKLTDDITVNENVLKNASGESCVNDDGSYNTTTCPGTLYAWTPIGTDEENPYKGIFDGEGKTVSGLYVNDDAKNYIGLFGVIGTGATVTNVGVVDSYIKGKEQVGSVAGRNFGTISNVYSTGSVSGTNISAGGVVGSNYGTISTVYSTGSVSGKDYVGGVTGYNDKKCSISNAYSTGPVSGTTYVGGVVGSNEGTVSNAYSTGTVNGTSLYAGGVAGRNNGVISNAFSTGSVSGNTYVGGVVGYNSGTISNAYSMGSVTSIGYYVGGVAGISGGTISNAYSTGSVSGIDNVGGVVGYCSECYISNGYFNKENVDFTDGNLGEYDIHGMSAEQFADGTVAELLHDWCEKDGDDCKEGGLNGSVWGQGLGRDESPTFLGVIGPALTLHVYEGVEIDSAYTPDTDLPTPPTREGYEFLGWYATSDFSGSAVTRIPSDATGEQEYFAKWEAQSGSGCIKIATADDLYKFATRVNGGDGEICGELTADITVNEHVLTSDGSLNADLKDDFTQWTPIGTSSAPFKGTFYGQGHTISGLYYYGAFMNFANAGLFGYVEGKVVIDGVGIVDSYILANNSVGALVGNVGGSSTNGTSLTISNSYNAGRVSAQVKYVGGLVGVVSSSVRIINSYNVGSVGNSKSSNAGGLVGSLSESATAFINNSYNSGTVTGKVAQNKQYDDLVYGSGTISVTNSFCIGESQFEGYGATQKTAEEFANGTVALLLHDWCEKDGDVCKDGGLNGSVWGQDFTKENSLPDLGGKFVGGTPRTLTLHTFEGDTRVYPTAYFEGLGLELPTPTREGYIFLGWYATSDFSGSVVTRIPNDATGEQEFFAKWEALGESGCIEIATAADLYNFAELVQAKAIVGGEICGKLTADITVNEDLLDYVDGGTFDLDGYKADHGNVEPKAWTPMNIWNSEMQVALDGNGKKISGLYINGESFDNSAGLFSYVAGKVAIDNLGIVNSYFKSLQNAGAFAGYVAESGSLDITNSYNASLIVVTYTAAAGFVGCSGKGDVNISQSYNAGSVINTGTATTAGEWHGFTAGGFVGSTESGTLNIVNSYNLGSVTASQWNVGSFVGYAGEGLSLTIANVYNAGVIINNAWSTTRIVGTLATTSSLVAANNFFVGTGDNDENSGVGKSAEEFANGTVAKLLHDWCEKDGDVCKDGGLNGTVWGQNVGKENSLPEFIERLDYKQGNATFFELAGKIDSAYVDATSDLAVDFPEDVVVSGPIKFKRTFAGGGYSTIMLPFKPNCSNNDCVEGVIFYAFSNYENATVGVSEVSLSDLQANTPYLVQAAGATELVFKNGGTFNTTTGGVSENGYKVELSGTGWTIYGTYAYKQWNAGDAGIGSTYGFAANDGVNDPAIVGQFAKVGAGAYIYPMRAYLEYVEPSVTPAPRSMDSARRFATPGMTDAVQTSGMTTELPEEIRVVVAGAESVNGADAGTMKVIGTINTRTGEFKFATDRWFDLNGRYLGNKKPTQKGAYYNNGKKVIVK